MSGWRCHNCRLPFSYGPTFGKHVGWCWPCSTGHKRKQTYPRVADSVPSRGKFDNVRELHSAPRPTRLSIREVRADHVHEAILRDTKGLRDIGDVADLDALRKINVDTIRVALGDLVAEGRVVVMDGRIRAIGRAA